MALAALQMGEAEKTGLADRARTEENAVRLMEESVAKNFTALVSGKLSKDAFVSRKAAIILVFDWKFQPQFAVGQRKRVLLTRVYGIFKCSSV
jgi:hypothetical protein